MFDLLKSGSYGKKKFFLKFVEPWRVNTIILQPELTSATPRSEILSAPSVVSSRFPGLMSL